MENMDRVNKEKQNKKCLKYYYMNRDKRIKYQREYDRNNKDKKRNQDRKRRLLTNKNKIRVLQNKSRKMYYDKLFKRYNGCQFCESKEKLEIHHKKYDLDISSCMLLCQKCHKQLHRVERGIESISKKCVTTIKL